MKLARILFDEGRQVAATERLVDTEMAAAFSADPTFKELEEQYPGFLAALMKDMKPAMARHARTSLPRYHAELSKLLLDYFDAAEIEDLSRFYESPTGQKMLTGMSQNMSAQATITEAATDPDKPTSFSAVEQDHKASAKKVIALLDASDDAAIQEFGKKPYFARVAVLGPAIRKIEQEVSNEPSPQLDAEIEKIMKAIVARYEAGKQP